MLRQVDQGAVLAVLDLLGLTGGHLNLVLREADTYVTATDHGTRTLGGLHLLTRTGSEDIAEVVLLLLGIMLIEHDVGIEIGTQRGVLQLNGGLVVVLMRIDGLELVFSQTGDGLKLLGGLVEHLGGILGVDDAADVDTIVIAVDVHDILDELEGIGEEVLGLVHDELIIAHTAIGLRDSHVLEELIAILVLNDDLDGVVAGANTNGDHRNGHVLVDQDILITLAIVLGIDAIVLGLGVEGLTHELLAGNVDIAEVGQRGHTGLLVAIVLERAAGDLVVILLAVVLTLEIDA